MKSIIQRFILLLCLETTATLLVGASRIPRTNLGIRTRDNTKYNNISTSKNINDTIRKVGGGGSTRGGASAVVAAGAAKTMSANQYKFLK